MRANASMAWAYSESLLLVVHAPGRPDDDDWRNFMEDVLTQRGIRGVVIVANSSRPTPIQRAEIQKWYDDNKARGALITDSVMMRGVVTAMNWFGVDMRAFAPEDLGAGPQRLFKDHELWSQVQAFQHAAHFTVEAYGPPPEAVLVAGRRDGRSGNVGGTRHARGACSGLQRTIRVVCTAFMMFLRQI